MTCRKQFARNCTEMLRMRGKVHFDEIHTFANISRCYEQSISWRSRKYLRPQTWRFGIFNASQ